jgi:hypothetical protein
MTAASMIYRIYQWDLHHSGSKRVTKTETDIVPTEAEAIISAKEALSRSDNIPDLFQGKDVGCWRG